MPTHDEIPERYPVLDHMELRLRSADRRGRRPEPPSPAREQTTVEGLLWSVACGVVGGVGVLGLVGLAVRILG